MIKSRIEDSSYLKSLLSSPYSIRAELCRRNFFFFVEEFWSTIILEDPVFNWHIEFICKELERVFLNVINRRPKEYDLILNVPPGTTKSTLCSVMFPAWVWIARNPENYKQTGGDLRFITGTYAASLSLEHAELSRDIIRSDRYRTYFPEVEIRRDKTAKSNFKINKGGNRFSASVGSTVTGVHGHFLIVDDPLNPLQAISDTEREKANNWMSGTLSTRKVDKAITPTILIMQRLHKLDPTGTMIAKTKKGKGGKKVRHIVLPGTDEYDIKPKRLKKYYTDGLLDPTRLSRKICDEMRIDLGSYQYAGQVGQDPRPREGAMFQREWFEIVSVAPAGGSEEVRGWDLAATTEKEIKSTASAHTAGIKAKVVDNIIYILDAKRFMASPNMVRTKMKNIASQDGPNCVQDFPQDPGQAGKDQAKTIAAFLAGFRVQYSTESGDKVLRAEPFSSQCEAGNVKLVEGEWNEDFLEEITFFPNGLKDQVDAVVRAFTRLVVNIKRVGVW